MCIDIIRTSIANNGYEVLACGIASAFFAQVIKFILFTVKNGKINFKIFSTTGGMPSSHSAGVMGLSLIIMYDAAGLRRAAGKTAACLNRMMDDFYNHDLQSMGGKLKELLGHTPLEVLVGAAFGILFAYLFHSFILG